MCRMRSVRETAKYFKDLDPDTEITEYTLRKMISEGTIQVVKTGGKFLINLDLLLETLGSPNDPINGLVKIGGAGSPVVDK